MQSEKKILDFIWTFQKIEIKMMLPFFTSYVKVGR